MRTFDLTPLYRSTVGFDQMAGLMDRVLAEPNGGQTYPPYNIEKTAEDGWRISIAAAGFSEDDLNVEVRENNLIVSAKRAEEDGNRNFLHRGIATPRVRASLPSCRPRQSDRRVLCQWHAEHRSGA